MKHFISFLTSILMLASCAHKQEAMLSVAEAKKADSLALHVALMPTLGCLPMYYAQLTGITDSLDLDIRLLRYTAQMDIDTAITRGHVDIAYTDIIRAIRLSDSVSVTSFLASDEPLTLVAQKGKKVKKMQQMSEKMIAICRLCATDYWSEKMLDSAKISLDSVYRPQINDVRLRGKMMCTGLLEGAILEEPYASWAIWEGNKKLMQTQEKDFQFAVWIATDSLGKDKRKAEQTRKFIVAYKTAVENINKGLYADSLRSILLREYAMPQAIIDTLQLPTIKQAFLPRKKDVEEAVNWLSGRGIKRQKFNPDTFINTTLFKQP
jgi:NitT/TauT family transport system substrate-binding protein